MMESIPNEKAMTAHTSIKTQGDLFTDHADPYLTTQVIAYIGNKRKLLPLLHKALIAVLGEIPRGALDKQVMIYST